jgi:DNA-binding transcriptional ArsR family regulator
MASTLVTDATLTVNDLNAMKDRVPEVAELLRFIATPSRLLLLCQLSLGESTVGGLEEATGIRQPALSQQLAELRQRQLVATRRESRSIIYRMSDPRVVALLTAMHGIFCVNGESQHPAD